MLNIKYFTKLSCGGFCTTSWKLIDIFSCIGTISFMSLRDKITQINITFTEFAGFTRNYLFSYRVLEKFQDNWIEVFHLCL